MSWPAIVFGWPGVIVSIGLSVVGLGWRSWPLVMAGLVIAGLIAWSVLNQPQGY